MSAQQFQQELNKIYDQYDDEKSKAGANVCAEWSDDGRGNKVCSKYPLIWVENKNGKWQQDTIPYILFTEK